MQTTAFARRLIRPVDRFLNIPARLLHYFPHLARHFAGVLILVLAKYFSEREEKLRAFGRRRESPFLRRGLCGSCRRQ